VPINSIAATHGILEFIEECKLLPYNEVIFSDHRAYVVNINLEEYFNEQLSQWDKINKVILNPSQCSHRKKFVEELEY